MVVNRNLAKQSGYGTYLDCDFATTVVNDKTAIVGDLADYVAELEQVCFEKEKAKSKMTKIKKCDKKRLEETEEMIGRICRQLMISPTEFELQIYAMQRNLDLANLLLAQSNMKIENLESTIKAIENVSRTSHETIVDMKKEVIKE